MYVHGRLDATQPRNQLTEHLLLEGEWLPVKDIEHRLVPGLEETIEMIRLELGSLPGQGAAFVSIVERTLTVGLQRIERGKDRELSIDERPQQARLLAMK